MLILHMVCSNKKPLSSLYFFASASRFHQCVCYDQEITVIHRGHLINKMADIYIKTFSMRSKNKFIAFFAGELLLLFKCVIDVWIVKLV